MNIMDEVFGNSSSDTVMEAELSQVLKTIHHDLASLHCCHLRTPSSISSDITTNVAHVASHPQAKLPPSHLKSETMNHMRQPTAAPRSCRSNHLPVVKEQPRTFSDNASFQHHSYVNVQTCCPASTYGSFPGLSQPATLLPLSHTTVLPKYMNVPLVPLSPQPSSNSAPSTPHGQNGKQHMHHSYIELWSGMQEERDSLSDSECDELKRSFQEPQTPTNRSSPGYVQMTSPFVKSPHVTSSFNGSVLANFATKLASYAGQQPRSIFCPFCPRYFSYEKSLSSHIHKMHRMELNSMVTNVCSNLQLQFCPICQAQFFNTSVLPKHLVDFHRASVIEVLEKNGCILSDSMGIHCPFCTKMVPHSKTGEQVLLYHIQQLHLSDYSAMIKKLFRPHTAASFQSPRSQSLEEMVEAGTFHPRVTSTPGLSNRLGTMTLSVQALNLDSTWSSHSRTLRSSVPPPSKPIPREALQSQTQQEDRQKGQHLVPSPSKGILRHQSELSRKPSVKRELRFSVPPVTSKEVFFPESPEPSVVGPPAPGPPSGLQHQDHQACTDNSNRVITTRVDSLHTADFMELKEADTQRRRQRLGLGLHSRRAFKKKDKENIGERGLNSLVTEATKMVDYGKKRDRITCPAIRTQGTRTFRRPKPVAPPCVPTVPPAAKMADNGTLGLPNKVKGEDETCISPFINLKLYSPLRMFRCNSCRIKFCDNESLSGHIGMKHKGLLHLLRPHYGCGVCSAKFFENKYLVKHCLQHHTSLLEIRSPHKQKITIYRFTQD